MNYTHRALDSCRHWGLCTLLLMLACGSDREEVVFEQQVVLLPSALILETAILSNTCPGTAGTITGQQFSVMLTQDGNDFSWVQATSESGGGVPLVLRGRICPIDDAGYELRLRGSSTVRVADGDQFCRTTLSVPSTSCVDGPVDDLCTDPAAVVMSWDTCSQSFYGRFPVGVTYEETVCSRIEPCGLEVLLSARLSDLEQSEECVSPTIGRVRCWDGQRCSCDPN